MKKLKFPMSGRPALSNVSKTPADRRFVCIFIFLKFIASAWPWNTFFWYIILHLKLFIWMLLKNIPAEIWKQRKKRIKFIFFFWIRQGWYSFYLFPDKYYMHIISYTDVILMSKICQCVSSFILIHQKWVNIRKICFLLKRVWRGQNYITTVYKVIYSDLTPLGPVMPFMESRL